MVWYPSKNSGFSRFLISTWSWWVFSLMPSTPIACVGSGTFLAALDFEAWRHRLMSRAGYMFGQILRENLALLWSDQWCLLPASWKGWKFFCIEVQFPRKRCVDVAEGKLYHAVSHVLTKSSSPEDGCIQTQWVDRLKCNWMNYGRNPPPEKLAISGRFRMIKKRGEIHIW